MRCMLLGYCFELSPCRRALGTAVSSMTIGLSMNGSSYSKKTRLTREKHDWLVQKLWLWWLQKLDAIQAEPYFLLLIQKLCLRGSLIPRRVRAIRVTRGGLEPSAIANFPNKLDRWRHIQNRRGQLGTRLLAWWYKLIKATRNMLTDVNHKITFRIPPVQIVRQSLLSFSFFYMHTLGLLEIIFTMKSRLWFPNITQLPVIKRFVQRTDELI